MGQVKSCTRLPATSKQLSKSLSRSTGNISDDFCDETIPPSPSITSLNSNGLSDDGKALEHAIDRIYQKLEATLNEQVGDEDCLVNRLGEFIERQKLYQELASLNFSMFREIAKLLEANANKRLDRIKHRRRDNNQNQQQQLPKHLDDQVSQPNNLESDPTVSNSDQKTALYHGYDGGSTRRIVTILNRQIEQLEKYNQLSCSKDSLNLILLELVDSSDCFAKCGCFKRAEACEKKAKLIALQLALLPHDIDIIDQKLSSSTSHLHDLIVGFDLFHCAQIVADAYDYHLAWRQAIFNHVILNYDLQYLDDYCNNCEFSTILVEELILLYKQYMSNQRFHLTPEGALKIEEALKFVIGKLPDVELKCKFYNQLKFNDAKFSLIASEPSIEAHLRDLKLA